MLIRFAVRKNLERLFNSNVSIFRSKAFLVHNLFIDSPCVAKINMMQQNISDRLYSLFMMLLEARIPSYSRRGILKPIIATFNFGYLKDYFQSFQHCTLFDLVLY